MLELKYIDKIFVEWQVNAAENNAAKEALTDMPPRLESELDPVTLHNHVIYSFIFIIFIRAVDLLMKFLTILLTEKAL